MEGTDDFSYDSAITEEALQSRFMADADLDDNSANTQQQGSVSHNLLTPSSVQGTPARGRGAGHYRGAPTDSMPSMAVSTPSSDKFDLEYERERHNNPQLDSQQSQFGLRDGGYSGSNSTADFSARLKGDVVVSDRWGAATEYSAAGHGGQNPLDGTAPELRDTASIDASSTSAPATPTAAHADRQDEDLATTPKMVRAQSDRSRGGNEAPGLRSALRKSRPPALTANRALMSSDVGSPRKVSFATVQPGSSSEAPAAETGPVLDGSSDAAEALAKDEAGAAASGADAQSQRTNATDEREPGDESMVTAPAQKQRSGSDSGRRGFEGITGVGMAGDVFRKFAGWTRGNLTQRSPALATNALQINYGSGGPAGESEPASDNAAVAAVGGGQDPGMSSQSSSQTASTVSPVRTESMRSQMLSNATTPVSAAGGSGPQYTPPRSRPQSAKRGANTPSRSVNPLTRHLALKAIRSAPPVQRSMLDGSQQASDVSPSAGRGASGRVHMLVDSPGAASEVSIDPAMLSLQEVQHQLAGLASLMEHNESAAHADVRESEEIWQAMQREVDELRGQLVDADAARDFMQQQADAIDRERAEWEQERQQLADEKRELQDSVDAWRQRIGSVENDHNEAWAEGTQTRQELLHTIVRLEEEVAAVRAGARPLEQEIEGLRGQLGEADEAQMEMLGTMDEVTDAYDKIMVECEQLEKDKQALQDDYDQIDSDNRRMQADLYDAQAKLDDEKTQAVEIRKELDGEKTRAAKARKDLDDEKAQAIEICKGLEAKVAELEDTNRLLKETAEDLTERNHELKQARGESSLFATAINDTMLLPSTDNASAPKGQDGQPEPEAVAQLKQRHREELARVSSDYQLMVESMQDAVESKKHYKGQVSELTAIAESARAEIEDLRQKLDRQPEPDSEELELLRRELDARERENSGLVDQVGILDDQTRALAQRNDELLQRAARLETELGDRQGRGESDEENDTLRREIALLQTMVADLGKELQVQGSDSDALRQQLAAKDVELDDAHGELVQAQEQAKALQAANSKLSEEVIGLAPRSPQTDKGVPQVPDTPTASADNSPSLDPPERLVARELERTQVLRDIEAEIAALESCIKDASHRRELLEKERRLLADGLRDLLINNRTLRSELTGILLRRAGKMRELQALQRVESHASVQSSEDAGASMISGMLNNVPSVSQLLDGDSKYLNSLDRHLDEVAKIIEDDDDDEGGNRAGQAPVSAPPGRVGMLINERQRKRLLTPIKEEIVSGECLLQDAATQCHGDEDAFFWLEAEARGLRASLVNAEQERDQFKASQEEAAERITQLTGQIEDMGEHYERMKAERITTARISLRVNRQLAVLKRALGRLSPRSDTPAGTTQSNPGNDADNAQIFEDDDAMLNATFDRALDERDFALFGLAPDAKGMDTDIRQLYDNDNGEVNNDEALEQIGVSVSEAYADLKHIRHDVLRLRRERACLIKCLTEAKRSKLPSYELSAEWGRSVRNRWYTKLPASLFLADKSQIMAEPTASKREESEGDLLEDEDNYGDGGVAANANMSLSNVMRDQVSAAREIRRLTVQLARKERRLRVAMADLKRIEESNTEMVQKLDRAYAERIRAQRECAAVRATVHPASRTPSRATNWDVIDSIVRELGHSSEKNRTYFANVDRLCKVLNQHTIDSVLVDESLAAHRRASELQRPEHLYRTLLMDISQILDVRGDLDERRSIRDNFSNMAVAVRCRLDEKDEDLACVRSDLDVSLLAAEAQVTEPVADNERVRKAERRAAGLETQETMAQEQLTTHQANIRYLNANISHLRQQCMSAEADVQEAQLERDGWQQQYMACEQTLRYQIEENDQMAAELKEAGQKLQHGTQEFLLSRDGNDGQTESINWGRIREEWTAGVREEAAETWRTREFELRQVYDAQIKILTWVGHMWGSVVRGIACHAVRDQLHQFISLNSALLTPSCLRNRASDTASSNGSCL